MAKMPKKKDLNMYMDRGVIEGEYRPYLGYSALGHPCSRYLWYGFRWAYDNIVDVKRDRIFERGNIEEVRIVKSLNDKGIPITRAQEEVVGITGHARGHIDGVANEVPTGGKKEHLFECKGLAKAYFKQYIKLGLKRYSSTYWQQIQSYMGHLKLKVCLYVVTNKDTEERDYQRIRFDPNQYKEGESKALDIITSAFPPERMPSASKAFFECKWCDAYQQCWNKAPLKVTCRTCASCDYMDDGVVSCGYHQIISMTAEQQLAACDHYTLDPEIASA